MAEFCEQCAHELGLSSDEDFFTSGQSDDVLIVLCEGCGPTNVDGYGVCIYDCEKHHSSAALAEAEKK